MVYFDTDIIGGNNMSFGKVMIFGDSYSTYKGYIPEGYAVYYSGSRATPPDVVKFDLAECGTVLFEVKEREKV